MDLLDRCHFIVENENQEPEMHNTVKDENQKQKVHAVDFDPRDRVMWYFGEKNNPPKRFRVNKDDMRLRMDPTYEPHDKWILDLESESSEQSDDQNQPILSSEADSSGLGGSSQLTTEVNSEHVSEESAEHGGYGSSGANYPRLDEALRGKLGFVDGYYDRPLPIFDDVLGLPRPPPLVGDSLPVVRMHERPRAGSSRLEKQLSAKEIQEKNAKYYKQKAIQDAAEEQQRLKRELAKRMWKKKKMERRVFRELISFSQFSDDEDDDEGDETEAQPQLKRRPRRARSEVRPNGNKQRFKRTIGNRRRKLNSTSSSTD